MNVIMNLISTISETYKSLSLIPNPLEMGLSIFMFSFWIVLVTLFTFFLCVLILKGVTFALGQLVEKIKLMKGGKK